MARAGSWNELKSILVSLSELDKCSEKPKNILGIVLLTLGFVFAVAAPIEQAQAQENDTRDPLELAKAIASNEFGAHSEQKYYLVPLDAEQLAEVADIWKLRVQNKLVEIANIAAALETAEQGEVETLSEALRKANSENMENFERYLKVVDSLRRKGGAEEDLTRHRNFAIGFILDALVLFKFTVIASLIWQWLSSSWGGLQLFLQGIELSVMVLMIVFVSKATRGIVSKWLEKRQVSDEIALFLAPRAAFWGLFCVGSLVAIGLQGANVGFLLTVVGGLGFLLAFIFQNTIPSFIGGFSLYIARPYDRGDLVCIDGVEGTIQSFTFASTILRSFDNQQVTIPNSKVWQSAIVNSTAYPVRRVDLIFSIRYEDDSALAKEALLQLVLEDQRCLSKPIPRVFVGNLGPSSVDVYCRPWVKTEDYWDFLWDLTEAGKTRLQKSGISIAYPQQDVHIRSTSNLPVALPVED